MMNTKLSNRQTTSKQQADNKEITTNKNNKEGLRTKKNEREFTPPSMDDVKLYFKENGFSEDSAERAYKGYAVADWHDSKGTKIKNWRQKMIHVWFKPENHIGGKAKITLSYDEILKLSEKNPDIWKDYKSVLRPGERKAVFIPLNI